MKSPFPYEKLAMHIFNWPDREMCLGMWYNFHGFTEYYQDGIRKINEFFDTVLDNETKRTANQ